MRQEFGEKEEVVRKRPSCGKINSLVRLKYPPSPSCFFSFLAYIAQVGGSIKYGQRTIVLVLVSGCYTGIIGNLQWVYVLTGDIFMRWSIMCLPITSP